MFSKILLSVLTINSFIAPSVNAVGELKGHPTRLRSPIFCAGCLQDRRTDNILWALRHLRYQGLRNVEQIPWQLLLGYGLRLYNSQMNCEDCIETNRENLLRE